MTRRARISDAELKKRLITLQQLGLGVREVIFSPDGEARVLVNSDGIGPAETNEAEDEWNRWASSRSKDAR